MTFKTKIDLSSNRQVKQFEKTQTVLSGGTSFGLTYSALTSGPDLNSSGETNTILNVVSYFSGNNTNTNYNWYDSSMILGEPYFSALTPSISSITQTVDIVFNKDLTQVIDGNTVALSYSGVNFDITPVTFVDLGGGNYSGSVVTADLTFYSANTLDYTGRTIWVDVSGITRTERLIVTNEPQIGYVLTCYTNEGMAKWDAVTGVTISGGSILWSAGTGTYAITPKNYNSIASGNYSIVNGFNCLAQNSYSYVEGVNSISNGFASHAEGEGTIASGDSSHAEGEATIASGDNSHAEGLNTKAFGINSHSEGSGSIASGLTSHAEGGGTIAGGDYSHSEGYFTKAIGDYSHASGNHTKAIGLSSYAGGDTSIASGITSFVYGTSSIAGGDNTVVFGSGITGLQNNTLYIDRLNIKTLPVYADNTAASSLEVGTVYRTSTGQLMVRY